MSTIDWRAREQARLDDGTYRAIPSLDGMVWNPDHYLHMSQTGEPDMVAFTATPEKGLADRQTSRKFGRYLRQYHPGLTDAQVHDLVVRLKAVMGGPPPEDDPPALQITCELEDIDEIFETPLRVVGADYVSCMHGKFTGWAYRPYHVYAGPDTAVAMLGEHGEIIARSVVSTKDKTYIRLYVRNGCEVLARRFKDMLKEAGYTEGSLEGNRLTVLPSRNGREVLPYLDHGGMGVYRHYDGHWIVTRPNDDNAEYRCDRTDGYGQEITPKCEDCGCSGDDCECYYCNCCEERRPGGCDDCSLCENCDRCHAHGRCRCSRCDECGCLTDDCECPPEEEEEEEEEVEAVPSVPLHASQDPIPCQV